MSMSPMSKTGRGLELYLHPGDEYLGSLEPESLQVLAFVKLYVPDHNQLAIKTSCIPRQFPREQPPYLRVGDTTVAAGPEKVIIYLQEQFGVNEELSESQQADLFAYRALLTDRLQSAMLYSKWLNSRHYVDFTRQSYSKLLPFPLTLFYLSWQHRAIHHLVMRGTPSDTTEEQRGMELVSKAEKCIGHISARLGDENFFNGEQPSSLDVCVYGYLEILLQSAHSSIDPLTTKLSSHLNLVSFCQRMRRKLFPHFKARSSVGSAVLTSSEPSLLWRDSAFWLSVGVATAVLCVQGVRVGLFRHLGQWAAITRGTGGNKDSEQ